MNTIDKLILGEQERRNRKAATLDAKPNSFEAVGDKIFSPLNMEVMGELGIYSLGFQLADFGTKYATKKIAKKALEQGATTLGKRFLKNLATNGLCTVFIHPFAIGTCAFAKNAWFATETAYAVGSIGYWHSRRGEGTGRVAWAVYDPTVFMQRQGWIEKSLSGAEEKETAKLAQNFQIAQMSIKSNTSLVQEIAIRNARLVTGVPQFQTVKKLNKWVTFDNKERYYSMPDRLEMCSDTHIPHFVTKQDNGEFIEVPTDYNTWREDLEKLGVTGEGFDQIKWPKIKRKLSECLTDESFVKRYAEQVPIVMRYVLAYSAKTEQGQTPEQIWQWASEGVTKQVNPTDMDIQSLKRSERPYGCVLDDSKETFESVMSKLITLSRKSKEYKWLGDKILLKDKYKDCNESNYAIVKAIRAFQQENAGDVSYQRGGKIFVDTGHANEKTINALNKEINDILEKNK